VVRKVGGWRANFAVKIYQRCEGYLGCRSKFKVVASEAEANAGGSWHDVRLAL